jgi:sulfatase maturation enzyme AslB (radical SAM superfamily)
MAVEVGFRSEEAKQFPSMLVIDNSHRCNAACIHCPYSTTTGSKATDRKNPFMSMDIFKKVADEAAHYATLFRISSFGEPLMHPQFAEMIEYAKSAGNRNVSFNTNGSLLTRGVAERVLRAGVDVIEVSVDAFSKEKYEIVRRGLKFDVLMRNMHDLLDAREKMCLPTIVMISIIDQPEIRDELQRAVDYWTPRVDRVLVRKYLSFSGIMDTKKEKEPYYRKRLSCPYPWERMSVDIFGNIRLCIDDWLDKGIIGNIQQSTIHDLWVGEICQEWRKAHLAMDFSKVEKCRTCTDWRFHSWDINYLRGLEEVSKKK